MWTQRENPSSALDKPLRKAPHQANCYRTRDRRRHQRLGRVKSSSAAPLPVFVNGFGKDRRINLVNSDQGLPSAWRRKAAIGQTGSFYADRCPGVNAKRCFAFRAGRSPVTIENCHFEPTN